MPLYEYVCRACGEGFEALVRSWQESVACPACGAADVEKQLSSFAFTGSDGGFRRPSVGGGCGCGGGGCGCRH